MHITKESLEETEKSLLQQQEQGLVLYHKASGALELIAAQKAQLADALTENQLVNMIESADEAVPLHAELP